MISSWVMVPVLSVHRISISPNVEMEDCDLMMVLCFAMLIAPRDKPLVSATGNISGVKPTATVSAKRNASRKSCLSMPLIKKITGSMIIINLKSSFEIIEMLFSKLLMVSISSSDRAMLPRYVSSPLRTTTPLPEPETTFVPIRARLV